MAITAVVVDCVTVKRKLVDFVTFRGLLFFQRVLPSFRVNTAKVSINPDFFIRMAYFDQSSGSSRVNLRKRERTCAENTSKISEFSCRGIL